jgi:hypothetical protein
LAARAYDTHLKEELWTMPIKRLIDARRMRKNPSRGFGWIDHRLLRGGYLERCSSQALALYLLLVCASDAQGLSYYSDRRAAQLLSLELAALSHARGELIRLGLIAYQKPLYQLLSLEGELTIRERRAPLLISSEPQSEPAGSGLSLKAMVESLLQKKGDVAE